MTVKPIRGTITHMERSPIRFILDAAASYPDAIHLEIGQPDFPTPPHVIEAAVHAARHEYTGYTANQGMVELREAVVTKLARENAIQTTPDNVMITIGGMQSVYSTMAVLLEAGDEILLPDPGYGNFYMSADLVHGVSRAYPTLDDEAFVPDFDVLEGMANARTKALFINSPGNPTGAVYPESAMREALEFCRRHNLYLVSDETYERLIYEGEHVSPARWDNEGRVISIFTVSKTYSMTGWRVGYTVANEEIVTAMSKIQEPMVSCVNTIAQHAAIAALLGPQDCVTEMRAHYRRRRDLAVALAREHDLRISYPHGAFYVLVDISAQPKNSMDFACGLLDQEHVAVAPGSSFGQLCDRYVRLSLCASEESLTSGMARLSRYLHGGAKELVGAPCSEVLKTSSA